MDCLFIFMKICKLAQLNYRILNIISFSNYQNY